MKKRPYQALLSSNFFMHAIQTLLYSLTLLFVWVKTLSWNPYYGRRPWYIYFLCTLFWLLLGFPSILFTRNVFLIFISLDSLSLIIAPVFRPPTCVTTFTLCSYSFSLPVLKRFGPLVLLNARISTFTEAVAVYAFKLSNFLSGTYPSYLAISARPGILMPTKYFPTTSILDA